MTLEFKRKKWITLLMYIIWAVFTAILVYGIVSGDGGISRLLLLGTAIIVVPRALSSTIKESRYRICIGDEAVSIHKESLDEIGDISIPWQDMTEVKCSDKVSVLTQRICIGHQNGQTVILINHIEDYEELLKIIVDKAKQHGGIDADDRVMDLIR